MGSVCNVKVYDFQNPDDLEQFELDRTKDFIAFTIVIDNSRREKLNIASPIIDESVKALVSWSCVCGAINPTAFKNCVCCGSEPLGYGKVDK